MLIPFNYNLSWRIFFLWRNQLHSYEKLFSLFPSFLLQHKLNPQEGWRDLLSTENNNKRNMIQITIRLRHSFIFIMFVSTFFLLQDSSVSTESTTSSSLPSTNLINISRWELFFMSDQANPIYNCSLFHPATKARVLEWLRFLFHCSQQALLMTPTVNFSLLMRTLGLLLDKALLILLMKQLRCH